MSSVEFPTTPLLSDFTEIPVDPEYPLSDSGRWGQYGNRFPFIGHVGSIANGTEFAVNGQYWTPQTFRAEGEASAEIWACRVGGGLGAANESWRLTMWLDDPDDAVGYLFGNGGGIGENYFARRYEGSFTSWVDLGEWGNDGNGSFGLRITPDGLELWTGIPGPWTQLAFLPDTIHRGIFYAALEAEGQGCTDCVGFSCFGAGIRRRTQLIRWTPPIEPLTIEV